MLPLTLTPTLTLTLTPTLVAGLQCLDGAQLVWRELDRDLAARDRLELRAPLPVAPVAPAQLRLRMVGRLARVRVGVRVRGTVRVRVRVRRLARVRVVLRVRVNTFVTFVRLLSIPLRL